jgi:hypothetical protein
MEDFVTLNREINGDDPESVEGPKVSEVPRTLAYCMLHLVDKLRSSGKQAQEARDREWLKRAAWRVEAAWEAVLAGDIADLGAHLDLEAAAWGQTLDG